MGVNAASALGSSGQAEDYVDAAADLTGLEPEFDTIVTDPTLDSSVPAATRWQKKGLYERTDFVENPYAFQQLSEGEKLNASAHEILESKQVNGFLGEELKRTHGISDEFADFLNYAQTEFPNHLREGMTQALTNRVLPDGETTGRRFYPDETNVFESLVDAAGFDLEEELFDEAKQEVEEGYSMPGMEAYDFAIAEGFYYETGSVAGIDYEFMAMGDQIGFYGPELARAYRQTLSGLSGLDAELETGGDDDSYFDDGNLEDFGRHWDALEKAYDEQAEYSGDSYSSEYRGLENMQTPMNPNVNHSQSPVHDPADC